MTQLNMCAGCLEPMHNSRPNQKYCSPACKQKAYRWRKRMMTAKGLNKHCEYCGDWYRDSRRGRPSKYCSASCKQMAYIKSKNEMEGLPF